jgi:(E)-4-hydroxy-3-methylbut-2-enyl-diphosphate synthase
VPHHRLKDASVVDHLVSLIEKKAAEIEAEKAAEAERHRVAAE